MDEQLAQGMTEETFGRRFPMICDAKGTELHFETWHKEPQKTFLDTLDPHFIWTLVETDVGTVYLPGVRFVNRSFYLVSTVPWTDEERDGGWLFCEDVMYDEDGRLIDGDPDDDEDDYD